MNSTGEPRAAADHLERVKAVLEQAMQLEPSMRSAFVRSACSGDQALQREVASLLAFEDAEAPWPEAPILPPDQSLSRASLQDLQPGQKIGGYRIERQLGRGGMGSVAQAVRLDDFEKRVALKVVHDRLQGELVRRFHVERQVLAQLEHPHIARILDGGTADDGRPFFVMELVEGEPIDQYCASKDLPLRQRLDLVLQVCSALELAHRNLVVHRDLKPSNILVTTEGIPKLLDFGIAKRLGDADTQVTRQRERPMTLRFASPEQIQGEVITTATDVYGLGMLLYQLLTESHPFPQPESDLELAEAIRDREPVRPSRAVSDEALRRELEGDLDAIIRKALRKDPEQRYGSVEQLAQDLRHYLDGRPVTARQGTWSYLASRFFRRHRLPITAATVVVLLSLTFATAALFLWQRAETARQLAEKASAAAELARQQAQEDQRLKQRSLEFLKEIFRRARPNAAGGEEMTAQDLLRAAEALLDREDTLVQAELLATIGSVYRDWGKLDDTAIVWNRAERLLREAFPQGHPQLAKAINNSAVLRYELDDYEAAIAGYRESLAMKQRFPGDENPADVAKSLSNLATAMMRLGQLEDVEELNLTALKLRRETEVPDGIDIGQSLRNLGVYYHETGQLDAAETFMRQAIDAFRQGPKGENSTRFASALNGLGRLLHDLDRRDEARQLYERAFELRRALRRPDHPHVVSSRLDLTRWLLDNSELEPADHHLQTVETWLKASSSNRHSLMRARAMSLRGGWLAADGQIEPAERLLRQGYEALSQGSARLNLHGKRALSRLEDFYQQQGRPSHLAGDSSVRLGLDRGTADQGTTDQGTAEPLQVKE